MKGCTGLDTNILARYYVDDQADAESAAQRERSRALIESGRPLAVCKTVLLELECVLRGYYGFAREEVAQVFAHVLAQPYIHVEDRAAVERAVAAHAAGLDFADALHHASYAECHDMATFDDRGFQRRARKLGLAPPLFLP